MTMEFIEGFEEDDGAAPAWNGSAVASAYTSTPTDPSAARAQPGHRIQPTEPSTDVNNAKQSIFNGSGTASKPSTLIASNGHGSGCSPVVLNGNDDDIVLTGYTPAQASTKKQQDPANIAARLQAAQYDPPVQYAPPDRYIPPSISHSSGSGGNDSAMFKSQTPNVLHNLPHQPGSVFPVVNSANGTASPFATSSNLGRIAMVNGYNAHLPTGTRLGWQYPGASPSPYVLPPSTMPYPPLRNGKSIILSTQNSQGRDNVIDLTSADDGSDGTRTSGDEMTIKSERFFANGPKKEDDDIEVVGEKPSEASHPVCIGQLTGMALILYPIAELAHSHDAKSLAPSPMPCIVARADPMMLSGMRNENIKLYSHKSHENFGVIEQRLANALGPMLTKDNQRGAGVWVEASVIRTREKSPMMLKLILLLYCHPHFVQLVSESLEKSSIYLEHPPSYDASMHSNFRYFNPHGTRPQQLETERKRREALSTMSSYAMRPYGVKNVEVQREQVEEMFKSLRSGADLGEVEADPAVITKLYAHQKQALAFLLDREQLKTVDMTRNLPAASTSSAGNGKEASKKSDEDDMISLWRARRNVYGKFIGWQNVVTEVEIGSDRPPPQCRGSILADDMGLGKTIVIIALIANTLVEARRFAASQPNKSRDTDSFDALAVHPAGKAAGQPKISTADFKSPLFGLMTQAGSSIAGIAGTGTNKAGKKKETKTQRKREDAEAARLERLRIRSRATLIVCPLSTVVNWESQLDEHIGIKGVASTAKRGRGDQSGSSSPTAGLSVYVYHGNNRTSILGELADHDVVITTFSTLGSEYSKQCRKEEQDMDGTESSDGGIEEVDATGQAVKPKGKKRKRRKIEGDGCSPLQQIEWFRVVLDEAHMIKEHSTIQARAACELSAERRTCLTGTPLQNSLNDLFSLMSFLKIEPFTDRSIWTAYIGGPAKLGDPLGVSRLQLLMRHLALRRTKQSTDKEGRPILEIPPKKDEIRYLQLDEQEKAFYNSHHRRYKHNFELLAKSDSLLRNYCSILQEVLRLRQICAHMALVRDSEDRADSSKGEDPDDVVTAIKAHGLSKPRALRLLALMRDTGAAQCAECDVELASANINVGQDAMEAEEAVKSVKKQRKLKKEKQNASCTPSADIDETFAATAPTPVLTRCQHLFCLACFQKNMAVNFPDAVSAADRSICSICREEFSPAIDAVHLSSTEMAMLNGQEEDDDPGGKLSKRHIVEHSTKIRALMHDLIIFSQNNPASRNYIGGAADLAGIDEDPMFQPTRSDSVKTVVFSQWTKLLDRCEDALNECKISFDRLDGGMARPERTKALNNFKANPVCEVLLVSLRAGGVGLNLTHASHVYLLEPSWNPSVENQAVDRIHRLGQTRPVKTVRLVVKDSIEANMLEIQKRKIQLANLSLTQTLSKAQLAERRLEDLRTLFK